jgi:hypothetical protein
MNRGDFQELSIIRLQDAKILVSGAYALRSQK